MIRYHSRSINRLKETWKKIGNAYDDFSVSTKIPETGETVLLRKFENIGLSYIENLGDITPEVVDFITNKYLEPEGFIAWRIIDTKKYGTLQEMVYFKGKEAIISVFKLENHYFSKKFLDEAISDRNLDRKIIVRSNNMCVASA